MCGKMGWSAVEKRVECRLPPAVGTTGSSRGADQGPATCAPRPSQPPAGLVAVTVLTA